MVARQAVKVQRTPITMFSKEGHTCVVFDKPDETPPKIKVNKGDRVLWCPWCGKWTVYSPRVNERDVLQCTGGCGWANTKEFHVKTINNLWWEDVPLKAIKALRKNF